MKSKDRANIIGLSQEENNEKAELKYNEEGNTDDEDDENGLMALEIVLFDIIVDESFGNNIGRLIREELFGADQHQNPQYNQNDDRGSLKAYRQRY